MTKGFLLVLILVLVTVCGSSQSVWHDNQPYGDEFDDIQFVDYQNGYAVGRDNGIGSCGPSISALFRTMDGGETWTRNSLDDSYEMTSVFFLDRTTGWASVYFGDVIKTTDCGQTWTLYDGAIGGDALDVFFLNENVGFLVGENGQVRKSTDGGLNWSFNYDTGNQFLYKVEFFNDELGFILGTQGLVLRTTDGGDNWEEIELGSNSAIFDIDFISEQEVFLSSYASVYHSLDGGQSFESLSIPIFSIRAIEFISPTEGFIAGEAGEFWTTTDGGGTWVQSEFPFHEGIYAMTFLDSEIGFMSGASGSIFQTVDGGTNWKSQHTSLRPPNSFGSQSNLRDVHFLNPDTGVVVGTSGYVALTYNGGLTWSSIATPSEESLQSVQWIGQEGIVTAGESGYFMLTEDMGETWVEKETGTDQIISDLWFTEDGSTGYLLCFEDTILKTIDYADTWEVQVPIEGEFYRGFDFLNEDFGVVIGNDFVFRTLDGGETWEERPFFEANSNLRCVDIVNDSLSYIGSTNTLISRNGGGFWDSISVSTSLFTDKMEFLNDSLGYMVSGTNVRVTSDSGRHWSSVTTACLNNSWSLDELDVIDEHHVHVVGDSPMRRMWSGPRSIKTKVMDDSYCLGEKINVGFYYDGYYINDNTYQAQLSDADGDFSSPIIIGSYFNDFVNRSPSGVISCEVPSGLPEGDGYRIRVVAVNPETFGSDNGFNISLVNSLQPSVELSYEAIGCGGTELDFNTESSQTGVIQTYSWQVNGESIAHTGMSWSVDSLLEGDVVQVLLNMQSACTDDEVISNSVIVPEVNSPTLIISEDVTIDQGQTIQLSASGFSEYEWTPSDFLNDPNIADPTSTPDSTITYTVVGTDEQGCTAVDSVTITVIPIVDGLYEERLKWIVSPNPVVDELYLSLNRNISGEILIISMDGSLLEQNTLNGKRARIEMSDYPTGIYILEVRENIGSHYIKIAKVN